MALNDPGHRRIVRQILAIERSIRFDRYKPTLPARIPKEAEAVLSAVAARFAGGSEVSLVQLCDAADCTRAVGNRVRRWARANGQWPYRDPRGGCFQRKGGTP